MFENLKHKNSREGSWKDRDQNYPDGIFRFHHSPGASTFSISGNEATRMRNCKICGFPCDLERDSKSSEGSWAGLGITYGDNKQVYVQSLVSTSPLVVVAQGNGFVAGDSVVISDLPGVTKKAYIVLTVSGDTVTVR